VHRVDQTRWTTASYLGVWLRPKPFWTLTTTRLCRAWRENRNNLVGFSQRKHTFNMSTGAFQYTVKHLCEYSIVLTRVASYHNFHNYLYTHTHRTGVFARSSTTTWTAKTCPSATWLPIWHASRRWKSRAERMTPVSAAVCSTSKCRVYRRAAATKKARQLHSVFQSYLRLQSALVLTVSGQWPLPRQKSGLGGGRRVFAESCVAIAQVKISFEISLDSEEVFKWEMDRDRPLSHEVSQIPQYSNVFKKSVWDLIEIISINYWENH
jgi:hypothetical protein